MAGLSIFAYRSQATALHGLDARIKLASLAGISVAALNAGPVSLLLAIAAGTVLLIKTNIGLGCILREMRWLALLLACIVLSRALTTPGKALFPAPFDSLTLQGFAAGLLIASRLLLISIFGLGLTATTRPSEIRSAVEWFLTPVPGIPHHKVATMIGLLVRFIPVILSQSGDIAEAQRARGLGNRKNPLFRIRSHCMPLLRRMFVTADRLSMAMQARCYGETQTPCSWRTNTRDWKALGLSAVLCSLMLIC